MLTFKQILRIIKTPDCWLRNHRTCKILSALINQSLDGGFKPKQISHYYMELNNMKIWCGNYTYAYANVNNRMPDRTTVFRLYDALGELKLGYNQVYDNLALRSMRGKEGTD